MRAVPPVPTCSPLITLSRTNRAVVFTSWLVTLAALPRTCGCVERRWLVTGVAAPTRARRGARTVVERRAAGEIGKGQPGTDRRRSVHRQGLGEVRRRAGARGVELYGLAVGEMHRGRREAWGTEGHDVGAGDHQIHAEVGPHEPGRHGSEVVVARLAVGRIMEPLV